MKNKTLMVLDGNSIVNRAFYGVRLLSTRDGIFTNAVYGFLSILSKLLEEEKPDALCVCFDVHAPTFRHKKFSDYKAQRKPMPEELRGQIPLLKEVLDAMNIPRYELAGWEADDLIGTIGEACRNENWHCKIVTGDRDSLQLINENVSVKLVISKLGKTTTNTYDREKFFEEYGFVPAKIVDLKALWGDPSDNIPGVPGIGEKTGRELVKNFGSLEEIYSKLEGLDLRESVRKKLLSGKDSAFISYDLATIRKDVPLDFVPAENLRKEINKRELYTIFRRLEFSKLITKYGLEQETRTEDSLEGLPLFSANNESQEPLQEISSLDELQNLISTCQSDDFVVLSTNNTRDTFLIETSRERRFLVKLSDATEVFREKFLQEIFSAEIKKIAHDIKPLLRHAISLGIAPSGFIFDTAVAAYLLNPTRGKYTLQDLAGVPEINLAEQGKFIKQLYLEQKKELTQTGMEKLFFEIELPLCSVLAKMEHKGIAIDKPQLEAFSSAMQTEADSIKTEIYALAGTEFNLQSPKQLGEVLFEKLALPAGRKTKTGYSTDAEVLKKLEPLHPVVGKIIEFREKTKLKTIVDGLIDAADGQNRIHSNFNMLITATGRLSSSDPNLQNIPTRGELGNKIRKMFIAPAGTSLIDADYSQIELRLLAHIAEDQAMIKAFLNDEDIHSVTASSVFGVESSQVTPAMRRFAKAVNFGIVYGIGEFSLAQDLGISRKEAREYIEKYFKKYFGVEHYMKSIVENAHAAGFVKTIWGRRRYIPELKASNHNLKAFGERVALNAPIQGTAADIIKLAMVRIDERLTQEKLRAQIVLQIHDELLIEAPAEESERVKQILSEEMENVAQLSVPLKADAACGKDWDAAKK